MYTFYEAFGKELSQVEVLNRWFTEFCEARGTGGLRNAMSTISAKTFLVYELLKRDRDALQRCRNSHRNSRSMDER